MAKHDPTPHETPAPKHESHPTRHEDTGKAAEKGTHVVTFAGQPPVTVTAGSDEEAAKKAAEQLGVVTSEKPPDVVKVT